MINYCVWLASPQINILKYSEKKARGPPYNQEWIEEEIQFGLPYSNFMFNKGSPEPTDIEFLGRSLI